jgi:pyruvate dehydrogenase E2 component (dihydrolipoamide acetyltransferase)
MPQPIELFVPDIGDFKDVTVIDVLFKPGDRVVAGDSVITLESEKATLDVPAEASGVLVAMKVGPGSRVSKGSPLLTLLAEGNIVATSNGPSGEASPVTALQPKTEARSGAPAEAPEQVTATILQLQPEVRPTEVRVHASPSVRRTARELDVDLSLVRGSGPRGRILKGDLHEFVRVSMAAERSKGAVAGGAAAAPRAPIDFAKFGSVERRALSRIQRIGGSALARNWATIPHVTNFESADITELEAFRKDESKIVGAPKLTLVSFLVKVCAVSLKAYPTLNSSLDGDEVILKKYVNIGVAVDTPAGLVVPVLKNVDQLGIKEIAALLEVQAQEAREGKLKPADIEGGCFTISSLGGIGNTGFTPIINAPEVAILGVCKATMQPRWDGSQFTARLILPLALSWDHRVLDGVLAARFLVHLQRLLTDFRRVIL